MIARENLQIGMEVIFEGEKRIIVSLPNGHHGLPHFLVELNNKPGNYNSEFGSFNCKYIDSIYPITLDNKSTWKKLRFQNILLKILKTLCDWLPILLIAVKEKLLLTGKLNMLND